ncbi:BadF/BadG/BcrA/BcrD ATPase family protein [Streptomyces sp. NPDC097619]|uniref:N-acetylglucosamine kinase n=1 Tax=Streptomyces sp. NPDC097619 TaxID=3157228 RepID=UPI003323C26A
MGVGTTARVAVLAIDAGNSKSDVALLGADGTVLGAARGGGFQPQRVGIPAALDVLAAVLSEAWQGARAAGVPEGAVDHVSACLANADFPAEEEALAAAIAERSWGRTVTVRNDTFALLRTGVDEPRGVAVVCGAGINCVGMLPDGRTARFPSIGHISGDWGGGVGLAEEAMWHAARAEDGRGAPTALARDLPAHFGLDSMHALIESIHLDRVGPGWRHEINPILFATASNGDPTAAALVARLADEIAVMAGVALTRLDLLDEEVTVVLGGSVLAAGHTTLNDRIAALLAERAPKAVPRVVTAPPVLGAGLLGLDALGAPPEARALLRSAYGR